MSKNLLSVQNEAISLVDMRNNELLRISTNEGNHAIVKLPSKVASRGIKTYSESRTEHRNLPFFNKMLEKESQFFCHQSSHVTRKAWMFRRILQELKKYSRKT